MMQLERKYNLYQSQKACLDESHLNVYYFYCLEILPTGSRKFPLSKIVGPPWKEGEIRLEVDKVHFVMKRANIFCQEILGHLRFCFGVFCNVKSIRAIAA